MKFINFTGFADVRIFYKRINQDKLTLMLLLITVLRNFNRSFKKTYSEKK
jgi:hypothetical protein